MATSEHLAGSQTAVIGTEHTLNTTTPETTDGVYQFFVEIDAMDEGDITAIRVKEKCRAGDTQRTILTSVVAHDPSTDSNLWVSETYLLLHGWDFTLQQSAGTGRAYPWSIRKVS